MSVSSVIFLLVYFRMFYQNKSAKLRFVYSFFYHTIFTTFFSISSVFSFSGISLTFSDASLLILIFTFFWYIFNKNVYLKKEMLNAIIIFTFLIILSWIINTLFVTDTLVVSMGVFWDISSVTEPIFVFSYVNYLVRFIFFFLILIVSRSILSINELFYFRKIFLKTGKLILLFGIFEFLTKTYAINIFTLVVETLFNETSNYFINTRGGISPILAFTFEPSQFVWSNLFFGLILINSKEKNMLIWFILLILESLISMSFTSILVVIVLIIYALYIFDYHDKIIIVIAILILSIFIFTTQNSTIINYYNERIQKVQLTASNKVYETNINSEIRIQSIMYTLSQFKYSPFLGSGLGTAYAYSGLITFIVSCGLCPIYIYAYIFKYFCKKWCKLSLISIIVFSIALFFAGSIADFYTFIFPLSMVLCNINSNKE